jgi:hypothetical protein
LGQLKDLEISKYKRESKALMPIKFCVYFLLIVAYLAGFMKSAKRNKNGTQRNENERNETKRNETKQKPIETKRNRVKFSIYFDNIESNITENT